MKQSKIALVQPYVEPGESLGIKKAPTGLQYIATQLEREGYDARMFHDYTEAVLEKLGEFGPDHVGISSMTNNYLEAEKIAKGVEYINKKTPVTLGGWHVSGCVNSYVRGMENESLKEILHKGSPFNYIIIGEGEVSYSKLLDLLGKGANEEAISKIKGIGFVDRKGKITLNLPERIGNLDNLGFPSWSNLDINEYIDLRSGEVDLSLHAQRSCRFKCGFCATPVVYPGKVTRLSPGKTVNYVEKLLGFKPKVITFTDEDFFSDPDWVREVSEDLIKRDIHKEGVKIDTFASVYDLHKIEKTGNDGLLDLMKDANFNSFTLGIESFNPETLRAYNREGMIRAMMTEKEREDYRDSPRGKKDEMLRKVYHDRTRRAVEFARKHGILSCGDYMVGYFDETPEEVIDGFKLFSDIPRLLIAYVPIFTPIPGTGVWKKAYDSGKLKRTGDGRIDWSKFDTSEGAMDLDYKVKALRNELEQEFYTSERFHGDMMKEIKRNPSLIPMFKGRFNFLNSKFPDNEKIKIRLNELQNL